MNQPKTSFSPEHEFLAPRVEAVYSIIKQIALLHEQVGCSLVDYIGNRLQILANRDLVMKKYGPSSFQQVFENFEIFLSFLESEYKNIGEEELLKNIEKHVLVDGQIEYFATLEEGKNSGIRGSKNIQNWDEYLFHWNQIQENTHLVSKNVHVIVDKNATPNTEEKV